MIKESIKRKLRSEKGTSIFFGLLLFLAASILSIVMLDGAVTAVKRVESDRITEQNFLTCSSAAKTLQRAIAGAKVKRTTETVTPRNATGSAGRPVTSENWAAQATDGGQDSQIGAFLIDWIQYLDTTITAGDTLTKNLTVTAEELEDVKAVCTVRRKAENDTSEEPTYDVVLLLSTGEGTDTCQMNVSLKGQVKKSSTSQRGNGTDNFVEKKTTVTEYTWTAQDIIYGTTERSGEDIQ